MTTTKTEQLETDRLILRNAKKSDSQDFFEILSDVQVNKYLPWFTIDTIDEVHKFIDDRFISYNNSNAYRYAICLKNSNKVIGYIWLSNDCSNDLGYAINRNYWNLGIATEAVQVVINKLKEDGFAYITATHDVNNTPSGTVMRKLGMKYKYSYNELWQPKNIKVTFRMFQLNFTQNKSYTYMGYWDKYEDHFIED